MYFGDATENADFPFIYRDFPLQNPTSSLFQAPETVASQQTALGNTLFVTTIRREPTCSERVKR